MHPISQQSPQRPEPLVLLAAEAMASNIGLFYQIPLASSATYPMSFHRHQQVISRSQEAKTVVVSMTSSRMTQTLTTLTTQTLAAEGREVLFPQQFSRPLLMCSSTL